MNQAQEKAERGTSAAFDGRLDSLVRRHGVAEKAFSGDSVYRLIGISDDELGVLISAFRAGICFEKRLGKHAIATKYDSLLRLLYKRIQIDKNDAA